MTRGGTGSTPSRLYVAWYRCVVDDRDHAITDEDFARGINRREGRYDAVCGHQVLIGSVMLAPRPRCTRCRAFVTTRTSRPIPAKKPGSTRHRKPSLWARLFGTTKPPVVPLPRPPQRAQHSPTGRPGPVSGRGRAGVSTAPTPAGHNVLRRGPNSGGHRSARPADRYALRDAFAGPTVRRCRIILSYATT